MKRVIARTTNTMASHADVLRGSSRVSAPRTSFVAQERVTNPAKEPLREGLLALGCNEN